MKHTDNYRMRLPERRSSPPDPADIEDLNANTEIIDAEMHRLEVDKATKEELESHRKQAILDHPNNSVTDDKIGNRNIGTLSGKLTALFSAIGNVIKGILGTENWNDTPPVTLQSTRTHIDDRANPHEVTAHQTGAYTQTEVDNKISTLETNIDWKAAVETFADIATTYPNAQDGWTVNVKDTDYTYRYSGTEWVAISANAIPKATTNLDGLMSKEYAASLEANTVLSHEHTNKAVIDSITELVQNTGNSENKIMSQKAVTDAISIQGGGDMSTADYVSEGGTGVVLKAKNADNANYATSAGSAVDSAARTTANNAIPKTAISTSYSSTSTTNVASSSAVKYAYDVAVAAIPKTAISTSVSNTSTTNVASSSAVKYAYDAAVAAIPKTSISGYIDDASKSNVASAYLTNYLWQNLQTKVARSGDTMSGHLRVPRIYVSTSNTWDYIESRVVSTGVGNANCLCIQADTATNIYLGASQIFTNAYMYPITDNTKMVGAPSLRYNLMYSAGGFHQSCGSDEKKLIANVDFTGTKPKGRSAVGSIPINDLRDLINQLEIREYYRYKNEEIPEEKDEKGNVIKPMEVKQVLDTENIELGIFLDDVEDNPLFNLIGRKHESNGKYIYTMNTGSYASLALVGAKDSLNRIAVMETKANRYEKLCDLLVSKGLVTQEEISEL